jgi:transcriptional antiterminator RfaH
MKQWYVMHSKPNKEWFLFDQLGHREIESYLPVLKKNKTLWISRGKAFFPGYLFVKTDITVCGISSMLWIPGAKGIVCFGGEPAWVSEMFIDQLKHKMDQMNREEKSRFYKYREGDVVTIASGPFSGFQAVFNQYLPEHVRVRLLLTTLAENNVHIEIPAGQLAD